MFLSLPIAIAKAKDASLSKQSHVAISNCCYNLGHVLCIVALLCIVAIVMKVITS